MSKSLCDGMLMLGNRTIVCELEEDHTEAHLAEDVDVFGIPYTTCWENFDVAE